MGLQQKNIVNDNYNNNNTRSFFESTSQKCPQDQKHSEIDAETPTRTNSASDDRNKDEF